MPNLPLFTASAICSETNLCDCVSLKLLGPLISIGPLCLTGWLFPQGSLPVAKPGTSSLNIAVIRPLYFLDMSTGIIDSSGETSAGITSPAPFGPGTLSTPSENFFTFGTGGNPLTADLAPAAPPANSAGFCCAIALI